LALVELISARPELYHDIGCRQTTIFCERKRGLELTHFFYLGNVSQLTNSILGSGNLQVTDLLILGLEKRGE
jgi:hypothetical protein